MLLKELDTASNSIAIMTKGEKEQRSTLRDYVIPGEGLIQSIRRAAMMANKFKLKLALISMVQQAQFDGTQ